MRFKIGIFSFIAFVAVQTHASVMNPTQTIQLTHCLAQKLKHSYPVVAENSSYKMIDIPQADLIEVIKIADKSNCGRFINVTERLKETNKGIRQYKAQQLLNKTPKAFKEKSTYPKPSHPKAVHSLLQSLESNNIAQFLTKLTEFQHRAAMTDLGVKTARFIEDTFKKHLNHSKRTDVNTFFVKTSNYYIQPSLVTVIGEDRSKEAIVIGAHMDTLKGKRMPGAGDDGSGSATLMEVARVILNSDLTFNRPIYFIWYAAEEDGLVGSQKVVEYFQQHQIPVKAVVQFDMTGYRVQANDSTMWLFEDYTDQRLTKYLASLIQTYVKVPLQYSECGYGCSDHASWTEEDIPAAFPCETSFEEHNPYIHSSEDTQDRLSLEHMTNFAKLGLAYIAELAMA